MLRRIFSSAKAKGILIAGAGVTGLSIEGYFTGGSKFHDPGLMDDVCAVVTGATEGLGYEAAEELAKRKAHVIMVDSNLEKCEAMKMQIANVSRNDKLNCYYCDLSSAESIRKLAAKLLESGENVNLLINNAIIAQNQGVIPSSQPADVNLSQFLLTELLFEKVKQSGHGRVINVVDINNDK